MKPKQILAAALAFATASFVAGGALTIDATRAQADSATSFVPSATVRASTATFPLRHGRTEGGARFDYVVIEASTSNTADRFGAGVVNKLRNAGAGAQRGRFVGGSLVVESGVDFAPVHSVQGTPGSGFPPVVATPGSVGAAGYSPLVRLPDGSVINAPHVANATGRHDKVVSMSGDGRWVTLALTAGFARGEAVLYLSTDASADVPAALEGSTFAPRLALAPRPGDDSTASARASLAAFVNGPTGAANPQRQGINSALLGEGDPLNVLAWLPGQGRYSPLWDVHLSAWRDGVQARRVTRFADVEDLAEAGRVRGPGGGPWGANDIVVNCPIISFG
jgi:hypothetical protein